MKNKSLKKSTQLLTKYINELVKHGRIIACPGPTIPESKIIIVPSVNEPTISQEIDTISFNLTEQDFPPLVGRSNITEEQA